MPLPRPSKSPLRSQPTAPPASVLCPHCGRIHPATTAVCPHSGKPLGNRKTPISPQVRTTLLGIVGLLAAGLAGVAAWFILTSPPALTPEQMNMRPMSIQEGGKVRNFAIDINEVSCGEYRRVYPKGCQGSDTLPVTGLSFAMAQEFARKSGKRLCTVAEWLAAAREAKPEDLGAALTRNDRTSDAATPLEIDRSIDKNSLGVRNLLGNVSEVVVDPSGQAYYIGGNWKTRYSSLSQVLEPVKLKDKNERLDFVGCRLCVDLR